MDPVIAGIVGAVLGIAIGALIVWLVLRGRVAAARVEEQARAAAPLAAATATADALERELATLRDDLAVERSAREAREQRDDESVLGLLKPVQKDLETMRETVAKLERDRAVEYANLTTGLRATLAATQDAKLAAHELRNSLRNDNQTRGRWGEIELRRVVELSGMTPWVSFAEQSQDAGGTRPDLTIRLPGDKVILVDSKVPLSAYDDAMRVTDELDSATRARFLADHATAVRSHISALSRKQYWGSQSGSAEMVVMFIPSEALISAAMQTDPKLAEFALESSVVIASPVTLFSVLKAIAMSWRHEQASKNAERVVEQSSLLYERIKLLASRVQTLGVKIGDSVTAYNAFVTTLEGKQGVLPTARKIAELRAIDPVAEQVELNVDVQQLHSAELAAPLELDALAPLDFEPSEE